MGGVGTSKSWTAKLLSNPSLLREKIREEAGELCDTQEHDEGRERTASEMADLLYHSMVLLNNQVHALQPINVCLVMSYSRLIVISLSLGAVFNQDGRVIVCSLEWD